MQISLAWMLIGVIDVTSFNFDTTFTIQEITADHAQGLQFGYTIDFLSNHTLIVGAPSPGRSRSGKLYSCDIVSNKCQSFGEESRRSLTPMSKNVRCFSPPHRESCGTGTRSNKWYYDVIKGYCFKFVTMCDKKLPGKNVFDSKQSCLQLCEKEILHRVKTALPPSPFIARLISCPSIRVVFQNAHGWETDVMQKDYAGREYLYAPIVQGDIRIDDVHMYTCARAFEFKSASTSRYLFFIDEENRFDVVLELDKSSKRKIVVTIGTMEELEAFLRTKTIVKTGLSLVTTNQNETVSCQPQYSRKYAGSIGRCAVYDLKRTLKYNFIPFESQLNANNYYHYDYGLGGFSTATVDSHPDLLFVGAPQNLLRTGGIVVLSTKEKGKLYGSTENPLFKNHATRTKALGNLWTYSLSVGHLEATNRGIVDIVGGSPRGGTHTQGFVLIVRFQPQNVEKFSFLDKITNPDDQIGSYFGGSVSMVDVNGDKRDDILVGAPYHNDDVYEEGRVYVFITKPGNGYKGVENRFVLKSSKPRAGGRFGTCIANIGDVNKDGYFDVAIGAPGEGNGAVYIFNGNHLGISQECTQIISQPQISNLAKGFGFSISGGMDVNGDSYADIAIGAHQGQKVYVLKARPVVYLNVHQTLNVTVVPIESTHSNCAHLKGFYCLKMKLILSFDGPGTPQRFSIDIFHDVDAGKHMNKRAKLFDGKSRYTVRKMNKMTLFKGKSHTVTEIVYVLIGNNNQDLMSSIDIETTYRAQANDSGCGSVNPCPMLSSTEKTLSEISYALQCSERICKPYLIVNAYHYFLKKQDSKDIVYGITRNIMVDITIRNAGEAAYQPKLLFDFHSDFEAVEVRIGQLALVWERADHIHIPSTIDANSEQTLTMKLALTKRKPSVPLYIFSAKAIAVGVDQFTQQENMATFNISTRIETCLTTEAVVDHPVVIFYSDAKRNLNVTQPPHPLDLQYFAYDVTYTFYVKNRGESRLDDLVAKISIPDEVLGVKIMCVSSVIVDSVPCDVTHDCAWYLKHLSTTTNVSITEKDFMSVRCKINDIGVRRRSAVIVKTYYFPDTLTKMQELQNENTFSFRKTWKSNFTSSINVFHNDDLKDLYYQRTVCSSHGRVMVSFIHGGGYQMSSGKVPIWIYAASVAGALLLILLIVLLLIKVGFFDKKNPMDDIYSISLWEDEEDDDDDAFTSIT